MTRDSAENSERVKPLTRNLLQPANVSPCAVDEYIRVVAKLLKINLQVSERESVGQ